MDTNFRIGFEKVAVGTRFVDESGNRISHEGMARLGVRSKLVKIPTKPKPLSKTASEYSDTIVAGGGWGSLVGGLAGAMQSYSHSIPQAAKSRAGAFGLLMKGLGEGLARGALYGGAIGSGIGAGVGLYNEDEDEGTGLAKLKK